jgi:hypothetical protein
VIARSLAKEESVKILLEDISEIRTDKIRRNLHALSQQSLSNPQALPFIDVTGIGALELAAIHSFVTTAFHHHQLLSQKQQQLQKETNNTAQEARQQAMRQTSAASAAAAVAGENNSDSEEEEKEKASSLAAPRLRKFR